MSDDDDYDDDDNYDYYDDYYYSSTRRGKQQSMRCSLPFPSLTRELADTRSNIYEELD